ncbi:RidA family protein [Nibricoccus sp. IMCC34717]|uniref:RidA family protein n=1 Tax=Nibricoccus sp. IMCC34717 TaxID=3034021 RepID=UPI00384B8406
MHRTLALASFLLLGFTPLSADATRIERFHLNEKMEKDIGFCQAVRVGNLLFISGSVGAGEMPAAIRQVMEELKATLQAHGLTFKDVVKETVYATDLDRFIENSAIRRDYYGDVFPAATWLGVKRLYVPELVVEIELIAAFPE